jgi:hypothetical protein
MIVAVEEEFLGHVASVTAGNKEARVPLTLCSVFGMSTFCSQFRAT